MIDGLQSKVMLSNCLSSNTVMDEFDFDDNDVVDANEDLLPLSAFLNRYGLINSDRILYRGPTTVAQNLVIPKIKGDCIFDIQKVDSPNFKHAKDAMAPPSTEQTLSLASA